MNKTQKTSLFLLRLALGWLFLYAGLTKILTPHWSAEGYIKGAKNFVGFYHWLLSPNILPTVNFLNEWGLTLLGISLILGIFVRLSSKLGILLMLFYYLVILDFPHIGPNSYIVDEHIIYILALWLISTTETGKTYSLSNWIKKNK